jgi:putative ABC transport system substrate-binding protein
MLVAPVTPMAQPRGKIPRVGVLKPGSPEHVADPRTCDNGFQQGLRDLGYVDGHNILLEYRYVEGQPQRLPALVAELVRLAPVVIWTHSTDAIRAVQQATTTIPIVVGVGINMVEEGFVAGLARPGGNLTGLELRDIELAGKRLELFKDAVPTLSRVAILVNPTEGGHERVPGDIEREARTLGVQLQRVEAGSPDTFEAAFATMVRGGADGVIIMDGNMFARHRHRLLELALRHRLPTMSGGRHFAEAGSLVAYGAFPRELCQRSAAFVDKILKGVKPANIPVERADRFYLVVNLKTAETLGLTLSPVFLWRADEVLK